MHQLVVPAAAPAEVAAAAATETSCNSMLDCTLSLILTAYMNVVRSNAIATSTHPSGCSLLLLVVWQMCGLT
jgi:hypothetical protein